MDYVEFHWQWILFFLLPISVPSRIISLPSSVPQVSSQASNHVFFPSSPSSIAEGNAGSYKTKNEKKSTHTPHPWKHINLVNITSID